MKKEIYFILVSVFLFLILIISCKKSNEFEIEIPQYDSIVDIDGNKYLTVKIGSQWWMAQDLKVKRFNDSTPIFNGQNLNSWLNANPSYCVYQNSNTSPGLLYNYAAVADVRKIAPKGWRIPTDQDWKKLEEHLKMEVSELDKFGWRGEGIAKKLKLIGRSGWSVTDLKYWPENSSGFCGSASGNRLPDGRWADPGLFHVGFWWTASKYNEKNAIYRYLDYQQNGIMRHYANLNYGFAIRCIKE